jgi:predicted dehydrogenase
MASVPFVYRFYASVREARERIATDGGAPLWLLHGTYLQDWLSSSDLTNWRVDPKLGGASRAFADIGVHWCDLAEFVSGQHIVRLSARLLTAVPERRGHPVTTEDAALIQFETDHGAIGSVVLSQITPGRKNRLWIELDGAEETLAFDQEHPEELWCGTREAVTILGRDPATLSAPAARFAFLPGGHPQGYADCFDAFVADAYESIQNGSAVAGMPTFADGLRAALLTDAVLASSREARWVDVSES